jgi:two-component system, LytTR family, sensor kinase
LRLVTTDVNSQSVTRTATPPEWAVVACLLLILEIAQIRPLVAASRATGFDPTLTHVIVGASADLALWLALTPFTFLALDLVPLTGSRSRVMVDVAGWLVIGTAAAAAQAWIERGLWFALGTFSVSAQAAFNSPVLSFRYLFDGNAQQSLVLLLSYAVLARVHRARREREVAVRLERSLADARLHALSLQLQPHFLFNTLNAIAALVPEDPIIAEGMLVRLGDLLRASLDAEVAGYVTLRAELERLESYVELQRMRFGDRLSVSMCIDPGAMNARVPSFLLQPLVENAISHGIAPRRGAGHIEVGARCADGRLILFVRDDGIGPPPERDRKERVGLGTTRARLAAMFPGASTLELSPATPRGTHVAISVPFTS